MRRGLRPTAMGTHRWYRVGGLDYLLKRSDIDMDATSKATHPT
jgi:hypothetical protein